ncbi:MAG: DinB family protein [Bacteroidota bacterium]|nr:DinB family protein [Bacteroidota bacterium]
MQKQIADRIIFLCDLLPGKFRQIPAENFQTRPQPDKWSQQEILGHLIDSAGNNHQRFVRSQIEDTPTIFYHQDQWVNIQAYQQENKDILIALWESYNRHLAHVISQVTSENLEKQCLGRDGATVTLAFLIEDYLQHLEHHLHQIIDY